MKIQTFSIARITAIMKRHVVMNLKSYIIAFGAVADVLLIILFASLYKQQSMDTAAFTNTAFPAVFMGGLIFTSLIFKELHHPLRSHAYLMLPASTAEKLTSYWLLSSVLYLLASIAALYVINFVLAATGYFILGTPFFVVNLFTASAMKFYGTYIFFHSLFLLGAVTFRNLNFLKTIVVFVTSIIVMGILSVVCMYLVYRNDLVAEGNYNFSYITTDVGFTTLPISIVVALMVLFWASAYFKLKEKQV